MRLKAGGITVLTLCVLALLGMTFSSVQKPATRTFVGTMNFTGAIAGSPSVPIIFVMTG